MLTIHEYQERIEGVMSKRVPRLVDPKTKTAYPWRLKTKRKTPYSFEFAFEVPIGYSTQDLRQEIDSLFAACGSYIELKDRAGITVVSVYNGDFPDSIPFQDQSIPSDPKQILLGYDRAMVPIFHSFSGNPHFLIAGMSGYGKTDLIRLILFQLISRYNPSDLEIDIIDGKGFSFLPFRNIPHIRRIVRDIPGALAVLKEAKKLQDERSNIVWYGGDRSKTKSFTWRIVLIDEAAQIAPRQITHPEMKALATEADSYCAAIACVGREAGVSLLYCTQRPDVTVINPQVKAQMDAVLCFRTKTASNSEIILDRPGAEKLPQKKPGRAIYSATEDITLQVPYVGNDEDWNNKLESYRKEPTHEEKPRDYNGILD